MAGWLHGQKRHLLLSLFGPFFTPPLYNPSWLGFCGFSYARTIFIFFDLRQTGVLGVYYGLRYGVRAPEFPTVLIV
jgi:hypothetical protein